VISTKRQTLLPALVGALLVFSATPEVSAQSTEEYDLTAVAVTGIAGGNVLRMTLTISSFTPDDEVRALARMLMEEGPDEVVDALRDVDRGDLRVTGRLPEEISFARSRPIEGGRRITVAMARPILMSELRNLTRSTDYQFGVIQFDVDENGSGEGTMIVAARVRFNQDGVLEIESYGYEPIRLTRVERID